MSDTQAAANDNTNVQPTQDTKPGTPAGAPANDNPGATPGGQQATMLGGQPQDTKPGTSAGAPESYDFSASIPEGMEIDEGIASEFGTLARGMNLSNEQANQLAAYGIKYGQQVAASIAGQYNAEVQRWGEEAKAAMGADFNKVMATAGAGIEAAEKVAPGIRKALNETGAGNRIEIIRAMELLGSLVQADPGRLINTGGASAAPKQSETWYNNTKR